jgi:energy-coupling factor transport system permease protein
MLWLLSIPFTALTAHYGDLVVFRLPSHWPIVGGPITGEAIIYGFTGGLSLIALLLVFAAFNVAVDQGRLLRMTPGFVYQAGVVAAIAIAFVPQMFSTWQSIREAQQVRGHRVRGIRDTLPLILPLLITALERAMQLAESMEARGFGGQAVAGGSAFRVRSQIAMILCLLLLGVGFGGTAFWPDAAMVNGTLLAAGAVLLFWTLWVQGKRVRRSRYRRWRWGRSDRVVLVTSAIAAVGWAAVWLVRGDLMFYYPYPPYSPWPVFSPGLGMLLLLLAAPALLLKPASSGEVAVHRD